MLFPLYGIRRKTAIGEQKEKMQKNAEGGLSASYNIGARYFIREILKPLPATERSLLEAKVPAVKRRTSCVYADLRDLISEMELRIKSGYKHRLLYDLPYPAWKKRVSAQDLRNRRIRRYFVCRLKRSEARDFSHVRFSSYKNSIGK